MVTKFRWRGELSIIYYISELWRVAPSLPGHATLQVTSIVDAEIATACGLLLVAAEKGGVGEGRSVAVMWGRGMRERGMILMALHLLVG